RDPNYGSAATASQRRSKLGMCGVVLLRPLQVLRRVDGDPEALVPEGEELPLLCKLRERRLLVIAALRHAGERFVAEHVHAGVDPVRQARRFTETGHSVVVAKVDHAKLRPQRSDDDRRGTAVVLMRL